MSTFFRSADKIKVGQTEVSVPSENGLDYGPGGRIDIYIPPTSKFIDLSQSKLKFNVNLTGIGTSASTGTTHLQLDAQTGAHSLIRSIRVFSGRKTALLEEIEGYDVATALRYDYETNENIKAKRAMTEGTTNYDPACRGTAGTQKTIQANVVSNPYFEKYGTVDAPNGIADSFVSDGAADTVKCELQLNTGLFRNEAVFPALLTDGLFVEILLQDKSRVFRSMDSTNQYRQVKLNPRFHSIDGVDSTSAAAGRWMNTVAKSVFFLDRGNNMTSVQNCPFKVGERVNFAYSDPNTTLQNDFSATDGIVKSIEFVTPAGSTNKIKITLEAAITNGTGHNFPTFTDFFGDLFMVSRPKSAAMVSTSATYAVENVEMIVQQIQVPDGYEQSMLNMMKEGGTINYDYRSFTNYRYSQLVGDNVANVRLPLIESRATSILCIPTDATSYSILDTIDAATTYVISPSIGATGASGQRDRIRSQRTHITGICDELENYQFIYDGKINPSRRVDVTKIASRDSISQQWLIEAEKALAMADIEPLSFMSFQENFFIGRALALGKNSVYDARGKDFNMQLEYTGATQSKPKLWNNFVHHLRRLEIKNGGLSVQI